MSQDNEGLHKYFGSDSKMRGAIQGFKNGSYDYSSILVSKHLDKPYLTGASNNCNVERFDIALLHFHTRKLRLRDIQPLA